MFEKTAANNEQLFRKYEGLSKKTQNELYEEIRGYLSSVQRGPDGLSRPQILISGLRAYLEDAGKTPILDCLRHNRAIVKTPKRRGRSFREDNLIGYYINDLRDELARLPQEDPLRDIYKACLSSAVHINNSRKYTRNKTDLLSAANEAIMDALSKYNPNRGQISRGLRHQLNEANPKTIKEFEDVIFSTINRGEVASELRKKWDSEFPEKDSFIDKKTVSDWILRNMTRASFGSVASLWTRAAINKILRHDAVIKMPIKEGKPSLIELDAPDPFLDENRRSILEKIPDESESGLDENTSIDQRARLSEFQSLLNELFEGMDAQSRIVVLKRFGIGLPRALSTKEIAEQEDISSSRIIQILNLALEQMIQNAKKKGLDWSSFSELLEE